MTMKRRGSELSRESNLSTSGACTRVETKSVSRSSSTFLDDCEAENEGAECYTQEREEISRISLFLRIVAPFDPVRSDPFISEMKATESSRKILAWSPAWLFFRSSYFFSLSSSLILFLSFDYSSLFPLFLDGLWSRLRAIIPSRLILFWFFSSSWFFVSSLSFLWRKRNSRDALRNWITAQSFSTKLKQFKRSTIFHLFQLLV